MAHMDLQRGTARLAGEFYLRKPDTTEKIHARYTGGVSTRTVGAAAKTWALNYSNGIQEDPRGRKEVGEVGWCR